MKKKEKRAYSSFHNPEPDYTKPLFQFPTEVRKRIFERLLFIYDNNTAETWLPELERICQVYYAFKPQELIDRDCCFDRSHWSPV